jgi:hypothetical protein
MPEPELGSVPVPPYEPHAAAALAAMSNPSEAQRPLDSVVIVPREWKAIFAAHITGAS